MINPHLEFQFSQIESISEHQNGWKANWTVPSTLQYLEGHFPENPILPAVAIIDGVLELIKKVQNKDFLTLKNIKKAKFLGLIKPGLNIKINLRRQDDNQWKCQWYAEEKLMAEVDLVLFSEIAD